MKNKFFQKTTPIILFLASVYLLVLSLYFIHRPFLTKKELEKSKLETLTSLRPASNYYLNKILNSSDHFDQSITKKYLQYHLAIGEIFPNQPENLGLIGFFLSKLGKDKEAINFYTRAIDLRPNFFWYYHNLAIIYFKNREYEKAMTAGLKVLMRPPEETIVSMQMGFQRPSMFYPPTYLLAALTPYKGDVMACMKKGYGNILFIIKESSKQLNKTVDPRLYETIMAQIGLSTDQLNTSPSLFLF